VDIPLSNIGVKIVADTESKQRLQTGHRLIKPSQSGLFVCLFVYCLINKQ
jgi:hypothetical protein